MNRAEKMEKLLQQIRGGLIVSCQALEDEPLHGSVIMGRMAYAALQGGACGIRANTPEDILEIRKMVSLPVIGLTKRVFPDSPVYITPTMEEVDALCAVGCEVIAMDATRRPRAGGETIDTFFPKVRARYPEQLFMADIATYEEGLNAQRLGFDLVSTTLSGYTEETRGQKLPDFELMNRLAHTLTIPTIGEGGISMPEELKEAMEQGVFACVVGTAITRPREITRRFTNVLK